MSEDKKELTPEGRRRPGSDWRLQAEHEVETSPMMTAGKVLAWVGFAALIVALLWYAVTKNAVSAGPIACAAIGVASLAFWVVTNLGNIKDSFSARGSKSFVNSLAFVMFVFGILILVNIIGARHHWRHDLTKDKAHSLSEQTTKILQGLDKDVQLISFVSPNPGSEEISERVKEYGMASRHIKIEQYDPQLNAQKRQEYNVTFPDTIVVQCGETKQNVEGGTESALTSAILNVTRPQKTKVYFLQGHGEKSIDKQGPDGASMLKSALTNEQYTVEALVLGTQAEPKIPEDAGALLDLGPRQKFMPKEMEAVKKWVDQGGKMFIALDPTAPQGEHFEAILGPRDVTVLPGAVVELSQSLLGQPRVPVVTKPESHKITDGLDFVAMPYTCAFDVKEQAPPPSYPGAPPPPANKATALLKSSGNSWLSAGVTGKIQPKGKDDRSGPLVLGVVIDEKPQKPPTPPGQPEPPDQTGPAARIVVIGSALAMTDQVVQPIMGNQDLVTKSVAWLSGNENLVSIPPREKPQKQMTLSGPQQKVILIIVLLVIPVGIMAAWLSVWWSRRRR